MTSRPRSLVLGDLVPVQVNEPIGRTLPERWARAPGRGFETYPRWPTSPPGARSCIQELGFAATSAAAGVTAVSRSAAGAPSRMALTAAAAVRCRVGVIKPSQRLGHASIGQALRLYGHMCVEIAATPMLTARS